MQRLGFTRRILARYAAAHNQLWIALRHDVRLFMASGHDQRRSPRWPARHYFRHPHDYRKAFAPRLGVAYSLDDSGKTVLRRRRGTLFTTLRRTAGPKRLSR